MSCNPIDPKCNAPDAEELALQMVPNDYLVSTFGGKVFCRNVAISNQIFAQRIVRAMIDAGWRNYWSDGEDATLPVVVKPSNPDAPEWFGKEPK